MRVDLTRAFLKASKKLPPDRIKKLASTIAKFQAEPKLPSLDFRPLKGTKKYYVVDSTSGDRILLRKLDEEHYEAVDCGTHDVYRRWDR